MCTVQEQCSVLDIGLAHSQTQTRSVLLLSCNAIMRCVPALMLSCFCSTARLLLPTQPFPSQVPEVCATPAQSLKATNCTEGASLASVVRSACQLELVWLLVCSFCLFAVHSIAVVIGSSTTSPEHWLFCWGADATKAKPVAFGQWPKSLEGKAKMGYNLFVVLRAVFLEVVAMWEVVAAACSLCIWTSTTLELSIRLPGHVDVAGQRVPLVCVCM